MHQQVVEVGEREKLGIDFEKPDAKFDEDKAAAGGAMPQGTLFAYHLFRPMGEDRWSDFEDVDKAMHQFLKNQKNLNAQYLARLFAQIGNALAEKI